MCHALWLARRGLGQTAPNPTVGCVIVSQGRVVGRGWTQPGGRPHAETVALALSGEAARGATAYVTLEPCGHHARTPPCAEALIKAGIARVVAAVRDPDPRVRGRGFDILRATGVEVTTGILESEAAALNAGFFLRLEQDRPLVTVKIAQSQDGKTIPPPSASRWITGEEARRFGHILRVQHEAVLVGIGTVLADDPELTCRLPGLECRSPVRVVLDSKLCLPVRAKLVQTARLMPTMLFTITDGGEDLQDHGVEVIRVMRDTIGRPALRAVLGVLAQRGFTRLLVEGGATVATAFLQERFADRIEVFTAPMVFGPAGSGEVLLLSAFLASEKVRQTGERVFGPDLLESYAANA
ncbi:MAG: bifunctional diaminohydroxyphosphoribosylaminopyrimidine deaminase/5-amino-6-(5-phosphoribosylamino)uracil reductase RibD [Alphaproteobacteria bacterium]|nr:bifunctional diaminohydroxyphosphoribosylaminopyrimidine deaminase/5-amino-6-(5-phosphoribosylamino)uracil reductase RibD [Alphaproteobacteria bacterium]